MRRRGDADKTRGYSPELVVLTGACTPLHMRVCCVPACCAHGPSAGLRTPTLCYAWMHVCACAGSHTHERTEAADTHILGLAGVFSALQALKTLFVCLGAPRHLTAP